MSDDIGFDIVIELRELNKHLNEKNRLLESIREELTNIRGNL